MPFDWVLGRGAVAKSMVMFSSPWVGLRSGSFRDISPSSISETTGGRASVGLEREPGSAVRGWAASIKGSLF